MARNSRSARRISRRLKANRKESNFGDGIWKGFDSVNTRPDLPLSLFDFPP